MIDLHGEQRLPDVQLVLGNLYNRVVVLVVTLGGPLSPTINNKESLRLFKFEHFLAKFCQISSEDMNILSAFNLNFLACDVHPPRSWRRRRLFCIS